MQFSEQVYEHTVGVVSILCGCGQMFVHALADVVSPSSVILDPPLLRVQQTH